MLHSAFHRENISYHKVKQTATTYQAAKRSLLGPSAPFASWIVSGEEWESFDAHGELPGEVRTPLSQTELLEQGQCHLGDINMRFPCD